MSASRWQHWYLIVVSLAAVSVDVAEAKTAKTTKTALLPIRGEAKRAERLAGAVLATLHQQRLDVLPPDKLLARLVNNSKVRAALTAAREAIGRSEQATLYMKRNRAIAAAEQATALLDGIAGRHHAETIVARAQLARGLAALLEPADQAAALAAFREAFSADPQLHPDPDRIPTRAAKLLRQARRRIETPRPPARQELALLAELCELDALLWVSVEAGDQQLEVVALRYDHREKVITGPQRSARPLPGPGADRLAADVTRSLGYVPALPSPPTVQPPPAPKRPPAAIDPRQAPQPDAPKAAARPWYKRWWVWTIAAGVVAGSVAATMVATARTERAYTFRFDIE